MDYILTWIMGSIYFNRRPAPDARSPAPDCQRSASGVPTADARLLAARAAGARRPNQKIFY
ncbi:hypothetical protein Taro_026670 [Colocasia esculenta]|uniref:Uncharacterized protein n=1 Tax=Colocasia esculenta TaxID=4460 RepID=A0A843VLB0_COLES|nr:hypothetical protein [Colocasia esculenta]